MEIHTAKKEDVREMFNNIAHRYDTLNTLLSAGIHKRWKKKVIRQYNKVQVNNFLDVATGTGDLAIYANKLKPQKITGIDISQDMIAIGIEKIRKKNLDKLIELRIGDSEDIPYSDNSFDAVTVAFGVRNFENLEKGLKEMLRVLKPGAMAVILEFSLPEKAPFRQLYLFYFKKILPLAGKIISRNKNAYTYLPDSVSKFPYGDKFLEIMKNCNYKNLSSKILHFGIATIYTGCK